VVVVVVTAAGVVVVKVMVVCFTSGKEHQYQLHRWFGGPPSAGLDFSETRKISCPSWDSKPRSSNPQPSHYKDYAIPAPSLYNTDVKRQNQILKHPEIKAAGDMVL